MIKPSIDLTFKNVTILFIISFFTVSFLSHLISFYSINIPNRLTLLVNLFFEIFLVFCLFKVKVNYKAYIQVVLLFMSFFVGQHLLGFKFLDLNNLYSEAIYGDILQINNYILIIFFAAIFDRTNNKKEIISKVLKIIKYFIYFNSILVLLGFIFNLEVFKSYPNTPRFGYMGLILTNTFAQFIYILLITYCYKQYQVNKSTIKRIELIYLCFIALLLGKKAIVLFLFLLIIYHFCFFHKHKKWFRLLTLTSVILIIVNKSLIIKQLVEWFPFWKRFDVNKDLLTVLSSLRDVRLENFVAFVKSNWTTLNYVFGGVNFPDSRVEMALIDLYMFFGFVGLIIYFNLFKSFFKNIATKDIVLLLFTLIIASLTGSFLVNINLVIIYYLLITSFKKDMKFYVKSLQ